MNLTPTKIAILTKSLGNGGGGNGSILKDTSCRNQRTLKNPKGLQILVRKLA